MRIIYSKQAQTTLDGILNFIASNYPTTFDPFQAHFSAFLARIAEFPESSHLADGYSGMRVASLVKYPDKLFYRYHSDLGLIEIVHIRHTAQTDPPKA